MDNSAFYAKIEPTLQAAMNVDNSERNSSGDLGTGFNASDRLWELIVFYSGDASALQKAFPDYRFTILLANYAIVSLPASGIERLAASPLVIYIERPRRLYYEVVAAKRASCITALQPSITESSTTIQSKHSQPDTQFSDVTNQIDGSPNRQISESAIVAWTDVSFHTTNSVEPTLAGSQNLTGRGTLLAVIDSGIDYTHPDFCNADGTTRIVALWDQTIAPDPSRGFAPPDGYALGTLFTAEQINEALSATDPAARMQICPSIDANGHGTHVTGIAAGSGRSSGGINRGVAYEASLLIVKLGSPDPLGFPSTTQLMQAVDFAARYAIAHALPLAVNLSFGNTYGSHSGTSLLETYLNSVATLAQICIVAGSGNEGDSAGHTGGMLRSGETRTLEFAIANYERSLSIQIWKNYWDEINIVLRAPGENINQILLPPQPGSWRYRIENTALLAYVGQPSPYNIYQEIYLDFLPVDQYLTSGIWSLTLSAGDVTNGIYDLWMPASAARGLDTRFLTPTPEITLTIPSTASRVITVGAYDSRSLTYATFSGRGYTWNTNQVKPDLVAPGVDILSTASGGGYESRSGTSMATPFVSGSCCLLMEWGIVRRNDPFLYGEKMKAYLIRGAHRLPFVSAYPDPRVGWGALCVADSIPKP